MPTSTNLNLDPTLPGAAWRYRWLVLAFIVVFAGLGWWFAESSAAWTATTTIAVQDPRSSIVFDQTQRLDPARYVADQIEIIRSRSVAIRTLDDLADLEPAIVIDIDEYIENLTVSAAEATDVISIVYSDPDAEIAVITANATADAYESLSQEGAEATFSDALAELDEKIAEQEAQMDGLSAELVILLEVSPEQLAAEAQLLEAIDDLLASCIDTTTAGPGGSNSNEATGESAA